MNGDQQKRELILLIRLDKMGDLISTLPVDQAPFIKNSSTREKIIWVIHQGLEFIPRNSIPPRNYFALPIANSFIEKLRTFLIFFKFVEQKKPQMALVFYAPWWISLALLLAQVPVRAGRKSQWYSFLFFNKGLRQKRSLSEKHEVDYNFELLHFAFNEKIKTSPPFLRLNQPRKEDELQKWGLKRKEYIVIHPGMAGSALNWPQHSYNNLISLLILKTKVVITGTAKDEIWLTEIKKMWKNNPQVILLQDQLSIENLVDILQNTTALVAPSTGVLHLAATLETPVVGLFSPLKSHSVVRWGPREEKASSLTPSIRCPSKGTCLEGECEWHPCLETITPQQVFDLIF